MVLQQKIILLGGGARPGDLKSPVRVGGGTIFGPVPRDYDFKLNKKVKQLARKSALSLRAKQNELLVLDALTFDAPKTKAMVEVLNNLKVSPDPDKVYGPILELGTSIIQTDRPEFLIHYLEKKGRRKF